MRTVKHIIDTLLATAEHSSRLIVTIGRLELQIIPYPSRIGTARDPLRYARHFVCVGIGRVKFESSLAQVVMLNKRFACLAMPISIVALCRAWLTRDVFRFYVAKVNALSSEIAMQGTVGTAVHVATNNNGAPVRNALHYVADCRHKMNGLMQFPVAAIRVERQMRASNDETLVSLTVLQGANESHLTRLGKALVKHVDLLELDQFECGVLEGNQRPVQEGHAFLHKVCRVVTRAQKRSNLTLEVLGLNLLEAEYVRGQRLSHIIRLLLITIPYLQLAFQQRPAISPLERVRISQFRVQLRIAIGVALGEDIVRGDTKVHTPLYWTPLSGRHFLNHESNEQRVRSGNLLH